MSAKSLESEHIMMARPLRTSRKSHWMVEAEINPFQDMFFGLSLLFWLLSRGIEKRKVFGWWAGTGILFIVGIGVPIEIVSAIFEEESALEILKGLFSALLPGAVLALIFIQWWKPRKDDYFSIVVTNTEPVAGGDAPQL